MALVYESRAPGATGESRSLASLGMTLLLASLGMTLSLAVMPVGGCSSSGYALQPPAHHRVVALGQCRAGARARVRDFDGHPGSGGVSASPNHRVEIERGERELSLSAGVRGQPRRGRCAIHRIGRVAADGWVTN